MSPLSDRELAELAERTGVTFSDEKYERVGERLKIAERHWRELPALPDHEPMTTLDGQADPLNAYITQCDTPSTTVVLRMPDKTFTRNRESPPKAALYR